MPKPFGVDLFCGQQADLKVGTISIVKEFHQLSYSAQRLGLPVSFLRVDSDDFLCFDETAAYKYDKSLEDACEHGNFPERKELGDFLREYTDKEKEKLAKMIQRAHWPFERVAACIAWAEKGR